LIERGLESGATLRTETTYRAKPGDKGEGRSYVLLADGGSASASEIFISALRENLGVPFVGDTTYGKGVGQAPIDTDGKGVAIITYGTARAASGADYNGIGLLPTHPSTAKPDAMLAQAAAVAAPGALARRAAEGKAGNDARRAALIDWNRRQAVRPDVVEWGRGVTSYQ
jgi:C-terminal processing protease CtpA/Prc